MRIRIVFLLLLLPVLTQAQLGQPYVDSLLKILPGMKEDTNRVVTLSQLTSTYSRIDAAKGIAAGLQGAVLARRLNWLKGIAQIMNSLGLCYTADAEYDKAMACLDTCYRLSQKNGFQETLLLSLMNKGVVVNAQGYISKALDYTLQSLNVAEQNNDSNNIALNLFNIGTIYDKLQDYTKTLDYERQAYPFYKHRQNKVMLAMTLATMADAYDGLGQRAKSYEAYTEALGLLRQMGDKAGMIINLANRAITYGEDKKYDLAIRDFSEAVGLADSLGDSYRLAAVLDNFANTYIDAANAAGVESPAKRSLYLAEAQKILQRALPINKKNKNLDGLLENYKFIALLDSSTGNYKEALTAYKLYRDYNDSILTQNNQKAIQKVEDRRQIDARDRQIKLDNLEIANGRNQRWLFIGGLLVLFLIGALLFLQSRQRKITNQKLRLLNIKLDEANKSKATLFGVIGHDLRAPLGNIINFLHLKKETPHLSEENREQYEKKITTGAQNLLYTMDELLLWGKGQMHDFSPQKERLAVSDLFEDTRLLYADGENFQIQFSDPEGMQLVTDGDYLKTILRNLTMNAIKAVGGQQAGLIVWRAWQEDGRAFLSISDSGRGMSEAARQVLLGQTALEPGDAPGQNGAVQGRNGLGLHLVRNFTAAIGVAVSVETPPGGGTVIVLAM